MSDIDIVIDIYESVSASTTIGTRSPYATVPYPGTGKKIEGWKWDKRAWPSDIELKANDFAPIVFDPATNFIPEDKFQSGIGDNKDLKLEDVYEEQASNIRYWTPRINHGYFYIYDQEWYLYSDDAVRDLMDATVLSGVLQYKDLEFGPKPGIPISVRRYKWNSDKSRYEIDLNFRKKHEFTGIITDGVEAATSYGTDYVLSTIDASEPEMVVEYGSGLNRVVLNANWEDQVGTSGTLTSLEMLGLSDGVTNEFHIPFAPVSPSGPIQLISWDDRTSQTYSWSRIPLTSDFTIGAYHEFKLDDHLGIVTFGDYDSTTTSGAGAKPGAGHFLGLVYTRGLELIYEPEFTRDTIEPRSADTNPFRNPMNQGFIKVSSQTANPQWIQLTADNITGTASTGYELDLGNKTAKLSATVLSSAGQKMEGETVTFEIIDPKYGTFSNLTTEAQALTDIEGKAYNQYVPPTSIDDIGAATKKIANTGSDTIISVDGLSAPSKVEDIYLYKIMVTDPVQGILDTEETDFYEDFLEDEGITEDPKGTSATVGFEKTYRTGNDLLKPLTSSVGDLAVGSKVIVAAVDTGVLDPNYFIQNSTDPDYTLGATSAPLIPHSKATIGSNDAPILEVTYSGTLAVPDNTTFKAYFLVCPATTRIRAKVVNQITGKTVYSNIISITINIPDEASGVGLIDSINAIQPEILKRIKNINEISDTTVMTTSGELWTEYLEDRLSEKKIRYAGWNSDSHTIGYWPLDSGTLHDYSMYANHALNVNGMVTAAGILLDGYRSTSHAQPQYLDVPDLYNDLNLQSGTIDLAFRTYSDVPSGYTFKMFEITVTGTNQLRNTLEGYHEQTSLSGIRFRFNYLVSGDTGSTPNAYLLYDLQNNGVTLTDAEWHTIRVSWNVDQATTGLTLAGQIDNNVMNGGVSTSTLGFLPDMGTLSGGMLQAIAGDLTSSGDFFFDEIRYSNNIRSDEWPPTETVTSGEDYITWFRRTRKADTNRLLLQNMVASGYAPARLPYGFRLKSTGITVASMLDRVTFITTNTHLPSDYYEE